MKDWIRLDKGGNLPPENKLVKAGVENGNVSYVMSDCFYKNGKWFDSNATIICNVDVYAWKAL